MLLRQFFTSFRPWVRFGLHSLRRGLQLLYLLPAFVSSLLTWKPQNIPFLSFPPEVRNRIFQLACEPRQSSGDNPIRFNTYCPWMFSSCGERRLDVLLQASTKRVYAFVHRFGVLPPVSGLLGGTDWPRICSLVQGSRSCSDIACPSATSQLWRDLVGYISYQLRSLERQVYDVGD
jgi:hypothetical protein